MARQKKKAGPWSDKKLLTWAVVLTVCFWPVGVPMLVYYFKRKAGRYVPPVVGWEMWDRSIHEGRGQADRMRRALTQDIRIKKYSRGVATVRGTTGNIYATSFGGCSCIDFQRRGLPCKHIYKLAIENAGFDPAPFVEGVE